MKKLLQKEFNLNSLLLSIVGFVIMFGITIVGLAAPALDKFDKWADGHRFEIGVFCLLFWFALTIYWGIRWALKRMRE